MMFISNCCANDTHCWSANQSNNGARNSDCVVMDSGTRHNNGHDDDDSQSKAKADDVDRVWNQRLYQYHPPLSWVQHNERKRIAPETNSNRRLHFNYEFAKQACTYRHQNHHQQQLVNRSSDMDKPNNSMPADLSSLNHTQATSNDSNYVLPPDLIESFKFKGIGNKKNNGNHTNVDSIKQLSEECDGPINIQDSAYKSNIANARFKVIPTWTKGNPPVLPFVHAGAKSCGNSFLPLRPGLSLTEQQRQGSPIGGTPRQGKEISWQPISPASSTSSSQITQADLSKAQEKGELITDRTAAAILFELSNISSSTRIGDKQNVKWRSSYSAGKIKNSKLKQQSSDTLAKRRKRKQKQMGDSNKKSRQSSCLYVREHANEQQAASHNNNNNKKKGSTRTLEEDQMNTCPDLSGPGSGAGGLRIAGVSRPNGYPIHDSEYDELPDYSDRLPYMDNLPAIHWTGPPMEITEQASSCNGLSRAEINLCSVLRLSIGQYRDSKRRILAAAAKKYKDKIVGGKDKIFRKTDAQKACRIDVNKASRLFCAFSAAGWLEESIFDPVICLPSEKS